MNRLLIGLGIASGFEGVDATLISTEGIGLDLVPTVKQAIRVVFPAVVRDQLRPNSFEEERSDRNVTTSWNHSRNIADTAVHAIRTILHRASVSSRDVFGAGLLNPFAGNEAVAWDDVADAIAEQTGITVIHSFRSRDRAAGGKGDPIGAAAEYLLYRHPSQNRCLLRLGAVTSLCLIPAGEAITKVIAFDVGPGNQLLDALIFHGSRGRDSVDPGGKKAVQGCCWEPILHKWLEHPFIQRKAPKVVERETFGRAFLIAAFETARKDGKSLSDLLCTVTHLIASVAWNAFEAIGDSSQKSILIATAGGTRNGFLWQLLSQKFASVRLVRSESVGIPTLASRAASAGVLAALTCDGVPGNLPHLTGAAGGRLLGQIALGDARNWNRCVSSIAEQSTFYPKLGWAA